MPDVPNQKSKFQRIEEAKEARKKTTGIRTMAEDISMLSGKEIKKRKIPKKGKRAATPNFLRRILRREEAEEEKISKEELERRKREEEKLKKKRELVREKEAEKRKVEEEKRREKLAKLKEEEEKMKKAAGEEKLELEIRARRAMEAKIKEGEGEKKKGKWMKAPNFFQKLFLKRERAEKEEISKEELEQRKREKEELKQREEIARRKEQERRKAEEEKMQERMALAKLKEEEKTKKELERLKGEEETRRAIEVKIKRGEEERRKKEEERQRLLKEREERKRFKIKKPGEEKRKEKLKKKIEKRFKIPPPPEPILPEKPKGITSPIPGIFIFILLSLGISGLIFFLQSYKLKPSLPPSPPLPSAQLASLPQPPSTPTRKECQGLKCIVIEGEGPDLCEADKDCRPVLPPIALDISEELELSNLSSDVFIPLLDKKFQKEYPPGTFIEIVPKYKGKLLTISQLFQALDLHPPKDVKDNLETYTLYLYSQKELFVQKRRNRIGIAFRIKEGKAGIVRTAMSQWEKNLPDDFYKVHTLWKRGEKASPNFLDNHYKGIHIRYTNFPVPDLSIDWAIKKDILILTTSRESMWRTIDIIK